MTDTAESEQVFQTYAELWNERDYSNISELVSEEFVLYDPAVPEEVGHGPEGEAHGPDGLKQFIDWLATGFPDFQITVLDSLVSEDVIMDEVMFTGTHEGALDGLPPTKREVDLTFMTKLLIADGKVTEHRVYIDQQEFAEQLGLTFPTVVGQLPKLVLGKIRSRF